MKSTKVLALIVGAIALFPSVVKAENVIGNQQSVDISTTTVGDGNVSSTTVNQLIRDAQKAGRYGVNVGGTVQSVTGSTTTIGNGNIDIKELTQRAISRQKAK
jgi:hypothetical protein